MEPAEFRILMRDYQFRPYRRPHHLGLKHVRPWAFGVLVLMCEAIGVTCAWIIAN